MDGTTWQIVKEWLADVAQLPAAEQTAYLVSRCPDPALRDVVLSLLANSVSLSGILARPALEPGARLGPYEVVSLQGAGGMGEVYRARDTRLGRDVAIKILPPPFVMNRDRAARFDREARVLAALNHPNIAAIYGVERSGEVLALVLELVEGDTLAERLARGKLSVTESLRIAGQITEAVESAHEKGIVHRDLKPANIKITPAGSVKVLDFGLAAATTESAVDVLHSPTLTVGRTGEGVLLGTAAYMSPEQARGQAVDKRADIWAFGCVLFEMLTGRTAFPGATASDHIAAILEREPDWTLLPASVPIHIRRVLRGCLAKNLGLRWRDISDVRLQLEPADAEVASPTHPHRFWPWLVVAASALTAVGLFTWRTAQLAERKPLYASLDAPPDYVLGEGDALVHLPTRTPMVFTPDGRFLIIQVARGGKPQLVLRSLDRPDARPIAGTDDARVPFVSPDGKWIGFSTVNEIRKVPLEGGAPTTICPIVGNLGPIGASWGARDAIIFGDPNGRIMRVPAGGGVPAPVTAPPAPRHQHATPVFLPDGVRFLFSDVSLLDARDTHLMIQSVDGGVARIVLDSATDARLLPSGRLAFMRLGTLMTAPFDVALGKVIGDPVAALSNVMQSGLRVRAYANNTGAGMFAVSSRGDLAVVRGDVTGGEEYPLVWVTQDGQSKPAEPTTGTPVGGRVYTRISPDGARAAVTLVTPTRFELWLADWERNVWTRCSGCGGDLLSPFAWSPDGRRLLLPYFDSLVAHRIDGSSPDQVLARESDKILTPRGWLTDGRIVYESRASGSGVPATSVSNVETKVLELGATVGRVVIPSGVGRDGAVSPDGHWLAYTAPQSGQPNSVVVQAFPVALARTTVSAASGGTNAVWSVEGRTLYYLVPPPPGSTETNTYAVDVATNGGILSASTPRELFRRQDSICIGRCYDVSVGPRFLFHDFDARKAGAGVTRMDLILNWTATLPTNQ